MSAPLTTTLAKIRSKGPCIRGWAKLLRHVGDLPNDAPLPLSTVLNSNGIEDALWVLIVVNGAAGRRTARQFSRECVARACDHAERALPQFEAAYPDDQRPRKAIEAARRWGRKPSAGYAAAANAYAAARAAGDAAAYAASTASEAERKWQVKRLRQYLDGKVAP